MAELLNLRRARKARDRKAAEAQAATNRAQHGQTPAEKAAQAKTTARLTRHLDGAKREDR